jgi:hypothetical protein
MHLNYRLELSHLLGHHLYIVHAVIHERIPEESLVPKEFPDTGYQ